MALTTVYWSPYATPSNLDPPFLPQPCVSCKRYYHQEDTLDSDEPLLEPGGLISQAVIAVGLIATLFRSLERPGLESFRQRSE
jgi:hypothetical protein